MLIDVILQLKAGKCICTT